MNREKLERVRSDLLEEVDSRATDGRRRLVTGRDLLVLLEALLEGGDTAPDVGPVHETLTGHWAPTTAREIEDLLIKAFAAGSEPMVLRGWIIAGLSILQHGTMAVNDHGPAGAPAVASAVEAVKRRVEGLEAARTANEAYDLEVHGSLKTLEGRLDLLEATVPALEGVAVALDLTAAALEAVRVDRVGQRGRLEHMRAKFPAGAVTLFGELLDALLGAPDVGQKHEWVTNAEGDRHLYADPPAPVKRGATPCPVCQSTICRGDVDARGCDTRAATRKAIQP